MKRLLWICWQPTPYHDFLFSHVKRDFELHVIYIKRKLNTHPWQLSDPASFKVNYLSDGISVEIVKALLSKNYSFRIVTGWDNYFFLVAMTSFAIQNVRYCIWTDTPNPAHKRSFFKILFHRCIISAFVRKAFAILVTGEIGVFNFRKIYPSARRLINFPTATNLEFFKPGNTKELIPMFCTVGRLVNSHKGIDVAIKAVELLVGREHNLDFNFKIIGSGPDYDVLIKLISDAKLESKIEIIQWLDPKDLLSFYQRSLFMVQSSHFDPYPNTIMEAMACGLAVVSSRSAGSSERVISGMHGFLFDDGDVLSLSQQIEFLLKNPQAAISYGQNARKVAENWTFEYNLKELEKIVK